MREKHEIVSINKIITKRLFGKYPKNLTRYPIHIILTPDANKFELYHRLKQAGYTNGEPIVALGYIDFLDLIYEAHANQTKWYNRFLALGSILKPHKVNSLELAVGTTVRSEIVRKFGESNYKLGTRGSRKSAITILLARDFKRLANSLNRQEPLALLTSAVFSQSKLRF